MKLMKPDKKSIAFRLTTLTIIIIIGQATLLSFFLIAGGVISQAEKNSYASFAEKVKNRKDYLQREMKYHWMNLDPYVEQISEQFDHEEPPDRFFHNISDPLISMLRATQSTGAFVILSDSADDNGKAAVYIRDYDPVLNDYDNRDLYCVFGPAELANELQIPLDQRWAYKMDLSGMNSDFYEKPLSKATLSSSADLLGYWSLPFRISTKDAPIITYSMPLFDKDKQLIGIIGVEVSEQYLSKFLPATDLQMKDSYGYILGYQESPGQKIESIVLTRAIQKRIAQNGQPLAYRIKDETNSIYCLESDDIKGHIYLAIESLGLYGNNTPFQQSQWYLIGIIQESHLLSYVMKIKYILIVSLAASVVVGVVIAYFVSYRFTKPIIDVAAKVKETSAVKKIVLENTGLKEVDELLRAIQNTSNLLLETSGKMSKIIEMVGIPLGVFEYGEHEEAVFITDQVPLLLSLDAAETENKSCFISVIRKILSQPEEDEEDIYYLNSDPERWLKIILTTKDHTTTGVIIDMTDEMSEKKQIMTDRDIDTLTGIYNRKAMQVNMEDALLKRDKNLVSAILMFDLDNLKMVNDTYGHRWGDIYINHAVKHLVNIPGAFKVLGRRSGDEFALFLYNYQSKEQLRSLIETFFKKLQDDPLVYPDHKIAPAAISAGMVWIDRKFYTLDEYLNCADKFMYNAKRNNKGHYCEGSCF